MRGNAFPDWTVIFNPPVNLCNTQKAIESTVAFRAEQGLNSMQMISDLLELILPREINRIRTRVYLDVGGVPDTQTMGGAGPGTTLPHKGPILSKEMPTLYIRWSIYWENYSRSKYPRRI